MFDWLKNKKKSLIPADMDDGLMSANFCEVKIGTSLTLPENLVCFVTYKDKLYSTIDNETFLFNDKNLNALIKKQTKKGKSLKKLNLDLFFVNMKRFNENFDFSIKIKDSKISVKLIAKISMDINVFDAKKFSAFVLSEHSTTDAKLTFEIIRDYVEYNVKNSLIKLDLKDIKTDEQISRINKILTAKLEKIGIRLNKFNLTFIEKTPNYKKSHSESKPSFFESFNKDLNEKNSNKSAHSTANITNKTDNNRFSSEKLANFKRSNDMNSTTNGNLQPSTNNVNFSKSVDEIKNMGYTNHESGQERLSNSASSDSKSNSSTKYCVKCGVKLINGAKYCHRCGFAID